MDTETYTVYEPFIYDNTTPNKDSNLIYGDDKIVEQNDKKLEEQSDETDETTEKDNKQIICDGCCKNFSTNSSLKRHLERSPVCQKWLTLEKEKPKEIEPTVSFVEYIDNIKMKFTSNDNKTSCKYCKIVYSTVGNLNKHYKASTVCNRFAYMDFQKEMKNIVNFY